MKNLVLAFIFLFFYQNAFGQVLLDANGIDDTYTLITSVLAPGHDPIEVPDCNHTAFGDHIDQVLDADLNIHVFRFHIHTTPDNDRCINLDRQRNEIKSYDKSPDNLLGVVGETVEYKWKFKIDTDFQASPNFTHLHQLKAVGGTESSMPIITFTARKSTPDRMELRYAESTSQVTLTQVDLAPFKGVWCEVTETVLYGENGTYDVVIKTVSDNTTLLSYTDNDIRMWRTDADFVRPKWGIYRSLDNVADLRDEEVLFANFSIAETAFLPVELVSFDGRVLNQNIQLEWQTASEQNNQGFEIQKLSEAAAWMTLDFVAGKGDSNTPTTYSFTDRNPINGINYYRLKQIDLDSRFQYSDTVAINFEIKKTNIRIAPNPTVDMIEVLGIVQEHAFELIDKTGKIVLQGQTENRKVAVAGLAKGTYFIRLQIDGETVLRKLVKN